MPSESDEEPKRALRQLFEARSPHFGLKSKDVLTETKAIRNACAKCIGVPPHPHLLGDNRSMVMVLLIGGKPMGVRGLDSR